MNTTKQEFYIQSQELVRRDGEFLQFIRTGGLLIDLPGTKVKHLLLQCFLVVILGNIGVVFFVAIFKNLLFLIHTNIRIERVSSVISF